MRAAHITHALTSPTGAQAHIRKSPSLTISYIVVVVVVVVTSTGVRERAMITCFVSGNVCFSKEPSRRCPEATISLLIRGGCVMRQLRYGSSSSGRVILQRFCPRNAAPHNRTADGIVFVFGKCPPKMVRANAAPFPKRPRPISCTEVSIFLTASHETNSNLSRKRSMSGDISIPVRAPRAKATLEIQSPQHRFLIAAGGEEERAEVPVWRLLATPPKLPSHRGNRVDVR